MIRNRSLEIDEGSISYGINDDEGGTEGRSIAVSTDTFSVVNIYVSNSGSDLKRLGYRIKNWDQKLAEHVQRLQNSKSKHKVIVAGDMNVAHESIDFHNPDCRRTLKQPGTTPEEQQSFSRNLLEQSQFIDTVPNREKLFVLQRSPGRQGAVEQAGYAPGLHSHGGT